MLSVFKTPDGERQVLAYYEGMLRNWPVPNRQHRLATRFGETFAVECGPQDAPAIVLLHGTAANTASWIVDVPCWSERFRVICVDIIGDAGMSTQVRPSFATQAHAEWLDDVVAGLNLAKASFVGTSLGGYLALDYATRRPERVEKVVLLNPGGVGRPRNILLWALPLLMLGSWGRQKMLERIGGPMPKVFTPEGEAILQLSRLIFTHFRPRTEVLPQISDAALRRATMPIFAILGGKDVFVDNRGAKRRLNGSLANVTVRWEPGGYHFLQGQTGTVRSFLLCDSGANSEDGRREIRLRSRKQPAAARRGLGRWARPANVSFQAVIESLVLAPCSGCNAGKARSPGARMDGR